MTLPVTLDLLRRYDRPGPRYTSYPTANEFTDAFGPEDLLAHLDRANEAADEPFSLYVHLPFCAGRCTFCGCNVVVTRKRRVVAPYLDALAAEADLLAARLPDRREVAQLHWGGGTPTYLQEDELEALFAALTARFPLRDGAEVALEVDPRVTTEEQLRTLARLGFNRLSMGVQDFDPEVQEAAGRRQSFEETRALLLAARRHGFGSVNVDLVYGLPHQRPETFQETLARTLELRPERVAVYSFAYVPWIKAHQRAIDKAALPGAETKLELFARAVEAFREAGYLQIGMDHFAVPEDELARARTAGTLHRNFQGYTVMPAGDTLGLGVSAIADVAGAYAQNEKHLARYQRSVAEGRLPTVRGRVRTAEDELRRFVITRLMCTFALDLEEVRSRFGLDPREALAGSLEALQEDEEAGFLRIAEDRIEVTETGRLFIRNVCMRFDAYLGRKQGGPVFSRTV